MVKNKEKNTGKKVAEEHKIDPSQILSSSKKQVVKKDKKSHG